MSTLDDSLVDKMFSPFGMMGNPMMGNPMMGNPMMGMGMMGMGIGMPMMTPMMPTPGVMPGVPGMGWYNSLPGRFGRDMLGRGQVFIELMNVELTVDFAGPGGVGSR